MSSLVCKSVCYRGVLHDVSLTLQRGKVCALLGPSGAGKSTLLWVLAGLWAHESGSVTYAGGRIGMVFQQPGLWDHLTVKQHLKIVGASPDQIDRTLSQMKLDELRDRRPGKMSGGERQRLSIARALVIDPTWLLLDEPMAHLDGPTRLDLFELLRVVLAELNAGVLIATHHAEEAMRLADECAILIDGQVIQQGSAERVYRNPVSPAAAAVTGTVTMFNNQAYRPEQLAFTPDPEGDAVVRACEFIGSRYLLKVTAGPNQTAVFSDVAMQSGVQGRITAQQNNEQ